MNSTNKLTNCIVKYMHWECTFKLVKGGKKYHFLFGITLYQQSM